MDAIRGKDKDADSAAADEDEDEDFSLLSLDLPDFFLGCGEFDRDCPDRDEANEERESVRDNDGEFERERFDEDGALNTEAASSSSFKSFSILFRPRASGLT